MRDGSERVYCPELMTRKRFFGKLRTKTSFKTGCASSYAARRNNLRSRNTCGKTYITINHNDLKEPFEVFITIGKSGSDVAAMADALGRMIS